MTQPFVELKNADEVVGYLEARAREFFTEAERCREAAATIRRVNNISTIQPTPPRPSAARPRAVAVPPAPAPVPPVAVATLGDATSDQILAVFAKTTRPLRSSELYAAIDDANLSLARMLQHLVALVKSGLVVRTGISNGTRYQRPAAGAVASPALTSVEAVSLIPSRPRANDEARRLAIKDALLSGPFKSDERHDVGGLTNELRSTVGVVGFEELQRVLGELIREKQIGILTVGTGRFYRRKAA